MPHAHKMAKWDRSSVPVPQSAHACHGPTNPDCKPCPEERLQLHDTRSVPVLVVVAHSDARRKQALNGHSLERDPRGVEVASLEFVKLRS